MAVALIAMLPEQFFDDNGDPVAGGFVYAYLTGTDTPQDTYSEHTLATENENPVELDGAGRATIYLAAAAYKIVLKDADGVTIWTRDPITGITV